MIALENLPNNSRAYRRTTVIRIGVYDDGTRESRTLKSAVNDRWIRAVRRSWQLANETVRYADEETQRSLN
jgi:hypothetical protein